MRAQSRFSFEPIGTLHTCFKDKFGVPRQSGLVREAKGILRLENHPFFRAAIRELEGFSHLWVIFVFHRHNAKNWKPSVRPPRLGGARKVGVLASRSPHRPNPIGMSVVGLEKIDQNAQDGIEIHVNGVDILDGTPVLDIKPYIPFADAVPHALSGWADGKIVRIEVKFSEKALRSIGEKSITYPKLKDLIIGILELDPRPAFQKRSLLPSSIDIQGTCHGFRLFDFDVKWKIGASHFLVLDVVDFQ